MAKLTEGIEELTGIENAYWDGANMKLTAYYNQDTTMERVRLEILQYLDDRQLQQAVGRIVLISTNIHHKIYQEVREVKKGSSPGRKEHNGS